MTRTAELEDRIREASVLVDQYETKISDTSDPREIQQCRRNIERCWGEIEGYLDEYLPLCRSLNKAVPQGILELAARYPRVVAEEFQAAYITLQSVVPPENAALGQFMWVFHELVHFHEHLNEWKEVHNLLQESLTALIPLTGELESYLESPHHWKKTSGLRMWTPCRTELKKLEYFMSGVKYVAEPVRNDGTRLRGASWMIAIITLRDDLDTSLHEGNHGVVYDSARQLYDECYTALYQADKHLRDMISQLNDLSTAVGRSIPHDTRHQSLQ